MNTELSINRSTARWIALGVGVLALIVGGVALMIGPLSTGDAVTTWRTVSYVAFAIGALGLIGFVMIDPESLAEAVTGRSGQYTITTWLMAIFFTAFVVAIFVIIKQAAIKPLDLTEAQKYQMSETTRDLLKGLKDDVHVVAFYGEGQDTERTDADLWLKQYANVSNGKITFEFVDPDKNPGQAQQLGMSRSASMVFSRGEQKSEASTATEEEMTNALLRVLSGETRKAYVIAGNGEKSLTDYQPEGLSQIESLLTNSNFEVAELNLIEQKEIPADANVVILPGPTNNLLPDEIDALNAYQERGGGLMVMVDAGVLKSEDPLIENLQKRWGISVNDDLVIDLVTQQFTDALTPLIFNFDETSPITKGMSAGGRRILMSTARSLVVATPGVANVTLTPLLMTANVAGGSWGETHYTNQQATDGLDDLDNPGPVTVGMSAENSLNKSRLVVLGDSDMASNQFLEADKFNGDLILNAVNWLSHKEDLISLPTASDVGARSLSKLTSVVVLRLIEAGVACLIPLIILLAGIVVWVVRRRRR